MSLVIKLGGSLIQGSALTACLDHAASLPVNTVIVPGGGVFADQVRITQQHWQFDDHAAHQMAILAMQQTAIMLNNLKPAFSIFKSISALNRLPAQAIWSPDCAELDHAKIPASWEITSDSLAVWLAIQLQANSLLIIKSSPIASQSSLSALQAQGILDGKFIHFANQFTGKIHVLNHHSFITSIHDQFA